MPLCISLSPKSSNLAITKGAGVHKIFTNELPVTMWFILIKLACILHLSWVIANHFSIALNHAIFELALVKISSHLIG